MRGAAPGEGSDGAALPTDNTDWGELLEGLRYNLLMLQDQPIEMVPLSLVVVQERPLLRGPWQLAQKSLRNGLAPVTVTLYGPLSTMVTYTIHHLVLILIDRSRHRVHGQVSRK
jgi:hypothetical protein